MTDFCNEGNEFYDQYIQCKSETSIMILGIATYNMWENQLKAQFIKIKLQISFSLVRDTTTKLTEIPNSLVSYCSIHSEF